MPFDFDFRFSGLPAPTVIDRDRIREFISDGSTKRINFKTSHANALHLFQDGNGYLTLPFKDSFEPIAGRRLNLGQVLYQKGEKYVKFIPKEDLEIFRSFIKEVEEIVFLRDCLDLSIALCLHEYSTDTGRSPLGEHEFQLKYRPDGDKASEALMAIAETFKMRLNSLPFFKDADYVMAVPSSHDFMQKIINKIDGFNFVDVSDKVCWTNKTGSLKDIDNPEKKLEAVDSWGFTISPDFQLNGKNVLLVDDMYQSGVSMQYVAMKLKEAGAKRVFGICICKSLGNK